jgi:hypothetical protein
LIELVPVIVGHIGTDEILKGAMFRAVLAEVNALAANDDFGIHEPPAGRTQAASRAQEGVISEFHGMAPGKWIEFI